MVTQWPKSAERPGFRRLPSSNWKKKCDRLPPHVMRRLKQLEAENAKQKKLVAYLTLDKATLQDVLSRKL